MLEFIRKRATGWVAWFIVILISIPFALWGIQEYMSPVSSLSVAKVNDTEIDLRQFQQAFQERRLQIQRLLGPELSANIDDGTLRSETLDRLVNEELVLQAASTSGMRIGDAQLAGLIQSQGAFRVNGTFSQQQYENWLRGQGYSAGGFEHIMRRDLLSNQFLSGLTGSSFATDSEVSTQRRLESQTRTFRSLVVPAERFNDIDVDEEAVVAHFEANKSRYAKPEQVTVEYLEIARADIAKGIRIDDAELRQRYETRQASFVTPEQREVSHILISTAMDAGKDATDEARARLAGIREQIENGADFAELANKHSEDPGTAQNGGALGFIGKGVMDPDFEEAAFGLEKDAVSEPVRTRFGWHLITVTDIRAPRTRTFEELKEQLRSEFQNEEADLIYSEQAEQLANLVFEHPESLEIASETLGVKPKLSEPFSREGSASGLGASRAVVDAAFSDDVLVARNNSGVIELGDGRLVAFRVHDHQPSSLRSLAEVRDQIIDELKQEKARAAAREAGEALLARLQDGGSLDAVAAAADSAWSEPITAKRNVGADPRTRSILFRMPRPQNEGRPTLDGRSLPNGDFQILALESVGEDRAGEEGEASPELRQTLAQGTGAALTDAYIDALRGTAEIVINQETLDDRL